MSLLLIFVPKDEDIVVCLSTSRSLLNRVGLQVEQLAEVDLSASQRTKIDLKLECLHHDGV